MSPVALRTFNRSRQHTTGCSIGSTISGYVVYEMSHNTHNRPCHGRVQMPPLPVNVCLIVGATIAAAPGFMFALWPIEQRANAGKHGGHQRVATTKENTTTS